MPLITVLYISLNTLSSCVVLCSTAGSTEGIETICSYQAIGIRVINSENDYGRGIEDYGSEGR